MEYTNEEKIQIAKDIVIACRKGDSVTNVAINKVLPLLDIFKAGKKEEKKKVEKKPSVSG